MSTIVVNAWLVLWLGFGEGDGRACSNKFVNDCLILIENMTDGFCPKQNAWRPIGITLGSRGYFF